MKLKKIQIAQAWATEFAAANDLTLEWDATTGGYFTPAAGLRFTPAVYSGFF